jgi:alpha-galactosidase
MKNLLFFLSFVISINIVNAQKIYDSRIGEKEILTPLPQKNPKINGPKVYGARPGKKFVYRIPCQGERPIKFKIKGLTRGLNLDQGNGVITGFVPEKKGEYQMTFIASNKHGKATRDFKLVIGDKIALTPPTGWNSWGGYMLFVTDEVVRKTADIFVTKGFADAGFQYISLDDCWMKMSQETFDNRDEKRKKKHEGFEYPGMIGDVRDSDGNIIPNGNFPDMKAMTDYIHSFGLKAGIYSSPGPQTCQRFAGSMGHEKQDADQYAAWGFDLLKYDLCTGGKCLSCFRQIDSEYQQSEYWRPMATYLTQ